MEDLRSGIEHLKQAKAHMSKANGIMSDHISKLKELEEENAELKAELDDWKGNAEGFQPDEYMKLPLDAGGVPIGVGDIVYRDADPEPLQVDLIYAGSMGYCTVRLKDSAGIYTSADAPRLSHKKPEPLEPEPDDSWAKLEEDAKQFEDGGTACEYFGSELTSCNGCKSPCSIGANCRNSVARDVLCRAKKLAGIEEEAQR